MVQDNVPVGLLGYAGDRPVAWCSIAPRSTYRDLGGLHEPNENPDRVWSLVCFYVSREYRGHGVMKQLIQAAVEHSRQRSNSTGSLSCCSRFSELPVHGFCSAIQRAWVY
ncbi:GNAT family N-acetyltransferase [Gordoniibacillus kamchatkensis]|uniref:GNAT family N-acetyltransferase n=1 Tax=Gordoniibacillus kamchatkensis TaxID=1590651 RepID=UPI00373AF4F8